MLICVFDAAGTSRADSMVVEGGQLSPRPLRPRIPTKGDFSTADGGHYNGGHYIWNLMAGLRVMPIGGAPMDILPYRGRVKRAKFALGGVVAWLVLVVSITLGMLSLFALVPDMAADFYKEYPQYEAGALPPVPWPLALVLVCLFGLTTLLSIGSWISLCIGRLHDLGCPAWIVLIVIAVCWFLPHGIGSWLVNLGFAIIPSATGPNRYGPDSRASALAPS